MNELDERLGIMLDRDMYKEAEILLKKGANPNIKDEFGYTLLFDLCETANMSIEGIKLLLKYGADPNLKNDKEGCYAPLHILCGEAYGEEDGNVEAIKLLLDAGADINIRSGENEMPLYLSCRKGGKVETVKAILDAGVDINSKNMENETPLRAILKNSSEEGIIIFLLENGAEL